MCLETFYDLYTFTFLKMLCLFLFYCDKNVKLVVFLIFRYAFLLNLIKKKPAWKSESLAPLGKLKILANPFQISFIAFPYCHSKVIKIGTHMRTSESHRTNRTVYAPLSLQCQKRLTHFSDLDGRSFH